MSSDMLVFADSGSCAQPERSPSPWRILIVDDEEDVHRVTRLVLGHLTYLGRKLEIISCYSGAEAIAILEKDPNFAIMLLDVVMEADDAGLKVVKEVRDRLKNSLIRIVLRTGQPGQAPEQKVIVQYDINDYKAKTELTTEKLFTSIISSLRAYRDLMTIEKSKRGLEKIVRASASIFEIQSLKTFISGVLMQLVSMLRLEEDALYCQASGISAASTGGELKVVAAVGKFEEMDVVDKDITAVLPGDVLALIQRSMNEGQSISEKNRYVVYFRSKIGAAHVVYLERTEDIDQWEKDLIDIFCTNIAIAFDNIYLNQELEASQKEIIFTLGEIVEFRSSDTHNHVRRVGAICSFLGSKLGLTDEECEILRVASAMHDIGKLAIPDRILLKEDTLTTEEFEVMKLHTTAGHDMLKFSRRNILRPASVIAAQHHEHWDGQGYPGKLKGEEINIFARITAVADVFDALVSDRCYRKALPLEEVINYFKDNSGKQFDPTVTSTLLDNLDEIMNIRTRITERRKSALEDLACEE